MSTPEQALHLLGSLGAEDRRWILERLPVAARARLSEHVDEMREGPHAGFGPVFAATPNEPALGAEVREDFEWRRCVAQLAAASPAVLVRALQSEPAWLVDALLNAANWPWSREVRKSFPAALRAELAMLEREGRRLGTPATRVLVRELADRSLEWPAAPPPSSGWRAVVERLRGGSRG
jgi:hypothetical protein